MCALIKCAFSIHEEATPKGGLYEETAPVARRAVSSCFPSLGIAYSAYTKKPPLACKRWLPRNLPPQELGLSGALGGHHLTVVNDRPAEDSPDLVVQRVVLERSTSVTRAKRS